MSPFVCFFNSSCRNVAMASRVMTLDCGGTVGRYVSVSLPDRPLPLCEVAVYSTLELAPRIFPQLPAPYGKQIIQI